VLQYPRVLFMGWLRGRERAGRRAFARGRARGKFFFFDIKVSPAFISQKANTVLQHNIGLVPANSGRMAIQEHGRTTCNITSPRRNYFILR
jgi:hypothetical protein